MLLYASTPRNSRGRNWTFESTVITKLFVALRFYTQNIGKKEDSLCYIYSVQAIYIINNIIHFIGNQIKTLIQKILKIGQ